MSSNVAVKVDCVSKCYQIYDAPKDRLKQFIVPRLMKLLGLRPKQYYKEFWALNNVSFQARRGETIGIVGGNGAGKSTLLQIICGTLAATSGEVFTNGRIAALLELGSGFNPEFTGRENVYLNGAILGLSKQEIDERIDAILAFADIDEFIDQPVKTYSSGMAVRLAFAVQANIDPEILIVDEALAVGDAYFVHRCMLRFEELQSKGTTILLVTHDATAVRTLCNRAVWLEHGQLKMEGDPKDVVDSYLAALMKVPEKPHAVVARAAVPEALEDTDVELSIPNIERRMGGGECTISGLGLYHMDGTPTELVVGGEKANLRFSIVNNHLDEDEKLIVGYTIRNQKGVDIASCNSAGVKADIRAPARRQYRTVNCEIEFPLLHPGLYSLNVSVDYFDVLGDPKHADFIIGALFFTVATDVKVYVLMTLKTSFSCE